MLVLITKPMASLADTGIQVTRAQEIKELQIPICKRNRPYIEPEGQY